MTRVKEVPVLNLRDALVYSDNIYLAQEALEIGADPFLKEAVKFGFEEGLPLQFPFPKASLANEGIKMIFNSRIPDMVKGSAHESFTFGIGLYSLH